MKTGYQILVSVNEEILKIVLIDKLTERTVKNFKMSFSSIVFLCGV